MINRFIPLLFILCVGLSNNCHSMVLDLDLNSDLSVNAIFWLNQTSNDFSAEQLLKIQNTINQSFPGKIYATAILNDRNYQNIGIQLKANHIEILQDTLNCIDFSATKSFFKEKYYLKLLLNSKIFHSNFFYLLKQQGIGQKLLDRLVKKDDILKININFPGSYRQTYLKSDNDLYIYQSNFHHLARSGDVIELNSSRFLPEVYITVFSALAGLILLFIRFIF